MNKLTHYEVSPYHSYWIDEENREFKESLTIWVGYMISGNFSPSLFMKALHYLTSRHESLRSTFLSMDDKYYITSEKDNRLPGDALTHSLMLDPGNEKDMFNWIYFKDHKFDIRNGPLFQARIARKEKGIFLVSFKIHRAILDSWSWDILMRDLFTAYRAFALDQWPDLLPLYFQYKEWLGWKNELMGKNQSAQKLHWYALYKGLPDRLLIPGAKTNHNPPPCRKGKKEYFLLSAGTRSGLEDLCRKYHADPSLMLRALFMLYLSRLTGQTDITVGTTVTGRTTKSNQMDQIGSYAYTDLSRIVFDSGDSLREAMEKVKKSFEDMYLYNDYTLLMALCDMDCPGKTSSVPFWNVNLDYTDCDSDSDSLPSPGAPTFSDFRLDRLPSDNTATLTDMDLKLKIIKGRDKIEIRVLYDGERYDSPAIASLITGYLGYIEKHRS